MAHIRPATQFDAEAIARAYVDTWRSVYAGLVPDRVLTRMSYAHQKETWARELGAGKGQGRHVLVADLRPDGVVGFISVGPNRAGPAHFDGEIYTLYVTDDFQNRGIGRGLLTAGLAALAEDGFQSAVVWVLTGNPARYFYEAMGGRRVAERNERLWGTVLGETAYGWPNLNLGGRERGAGARLR